MTLERKQGMLARFEFEIIGFDLHSIIVPIAFLDDFDERLPILLVHRSLGQNWDHVEPGVDSHSR